MTKAQRQRQRVLRQARYHFRCLRPDIYRQPPDPRQHVKACDCKVCKATNKLLDEVRNTN